MENSRLIYLFKKIFLLLIITILFWLFKLSFVNAETFDNFGILKNANFNGIYIYNNDAPYNNWAITENGESMALNTYIELYSDNEKDIKSLMGQNLLLTIDFCTMEAFDGLTNANNISGDANFIRSYNTQTIGSCNFKNTSYTGTLKRFYLVFSFNKYSVNTESVVWLSKFNITFWGGGYAQGGGYNQVNSINLQYFSQEIENQFETLNQNQSIINNQNQINSNLTDETSPNLNGLQNSAGWLKPGPVDSILNLPFTLLNNLQTNLGNTCNPVVVTLPYVDKDISLPCISSIYKQIDGLDFWFQSIGVIAAAFILYRYFMYLYNKVDDTLSFRENNMQGYFDDSLWGGM